MEEILNVEFCNKLVCSASMTIGHNVLITNEKGVIIANYNRTRIGSLHEASLRVIETKTVESHSDVETKKLVGTLPGVTIPIMLGERVLGTVCITGAPEKVSRYAELLQNFSQLFLDFQGRQQDQLQREQLCQELANEIMNFQSVTGDAVAVGSRAYELGYKLNQRRVALCISYDDRGKEISQGKIRKNVKGIFGGEQDLSAMRGKGEAVVFAALPAGEEDSRRRLLEICREKIGQREDVACWKLGVGKTANSVETLRESYEDALFALQVLKKSDYWQEEGYCLCVDQVGLEKMAVHLPEKVCAEISAEYPEQFWKADHCQEMLRTVECWCKMGFHFTQTARALHIHKSTLVYRFQRLRDLYGLDLYDFERAMALYLLILKHRYSN